MGTVGASAGTITLPTGYVIDSTKLSSQVSSFFGFIITMTGSSATLVDGNALSVLSYNGTDTNFLQLYRTRDGGVWTTSNPASAFANSTEVTFFVSFPVAQ